MLKMVKNAGFLLTLHSSLLVLNARNPLIFIRGERGTSCFL